MVKRAVDMFVKSKSLMNVKHEYALVSLRGSKAVKAQNFTDNLRTFIEAINDLTMAENCDAIDLCSVFKVIDTMMTLPAVANEPCAIVAPPLYVVRVILIYGRRNYIPEWAAVAKDEMFRKLTGSQWFFLDVLYVHDVPSANNSCQVIFDTLCSLDQRGTSYIVEAPHNAILIHDCMAKLLAHPLQRPRQDKVAYRVSLINRTD